MLWDLDSVALFQIHTTALHTGLSLVGHAHAVAGVEVAGAGAADEGTGAGDAAPAAAAAAPAAAPAVGEYARYLQLKEKFRGRLAK